MSAMLSISPFPLAGEGRRAAAAEDTSFLNALIASAEKQFQQAAAPAAVLVEAPAEEIRLPHKTPFEPLQRAWSWLNRKCTLSTTKHLRVAETVSLGEKRFVAVIHVEGRRFLIGGGSAGVSLLTQLEETPASDVLAPVGAGDPE